MKNDLPLQPLTIYLLRKGSTFSQTIAGEGFPTQVIPLSEGATATLVSPLPEPAPPKWADFLKQSFQIPDNLLSQSARAILLVEAADNSFALTFGHSYHLLDQSIIERDFGLKVVLNEVPSDKIRSIDRTSLQSDPLQSRTQASTTTDIYRFGIDVERDLLSAATGQPSDSTYGKRLSGADALHVTLPITPRDLPSLLNKCIRSYRKKHYQTTYPWFDNIHAIEDQGKIDDLDQELDALLLQAKQSPSDQIALIVPKVIDWTNIKGFYFAKYKNKAIWHPELYLRDWFTFLKTNAPTVEIAKRGHLYAFDDATNDVVESWRIYNCLSCEVSTDGKVFLLHDGQWFQIASDLVNDVDTFITRRGQWKGGLLPYSGHDHEKDYNKEAAAKLGMFLFDRRNIPYGGGHSKVEACDLMSRSGEMIHVKRLSCGSSGLSHLFTQALVGTELMLRDSEFRKKVSALIPNLSDRVKMDAIMKDRTKLTAVAAICKGKAKRNVPFFGRIALRNMLQRFDGMGVKSFYKIV